MKMHSMRIRTGLSGMPMALPRRHAECPWLYKTCMFSTYFTEQMPAIYQRDRGALRPGLLLHEWLAGHAGTGSLLLRELSEGLSRTDWRHSAAGDGSAQPDLQEVLRSLHGPHRRGVEAMGRCDPKDGP